MLTFEQGFGNVLQNLRAPFGSRPRAGTVRSVGTYAAGESLVPAPVEQPPWVTKPSGGQDFIEPNIASVALPVIAAEVTVVTFTVPLGQNGVIKRMANQYVGGGWTEGNAALIWRLEADGVPIRNFENIIFTIGTTNTPQDFGDGGIRVFENQVIALIARNAAIAVAGQLLLGSLAGWYYPIEQEGESAYQ